MTAVPYQLLRDRKSFQEPLEAAVAEANRILTTRHGGGTRPAALLSEAVSDHRALTRFSAEVARHLAEGTLHQLPSVRRGVSRIRRLHHMTSGRFRGIFLVDGETRQAVALLFTRSPHSIETRLDEIAQPYIRSQERKDESSDG